MRSRAATAAQALSEEFHGRPPHTLTTMVERKRYRSNLTDLGGLEELTVVTPTGYEVNLRFGYDTRLAADPQSNTLYVVGGDTSVDLTEFPLDEHEKAKDEIVLGAVAEIAYYTAKHHLSARDRQGGTYQHSFGEDGGQQPVLIYDQLNEELRLAGGSYRIEDAGIVN